MAANQPLIILIDRENQQVYLYGQFTRTIKFSDMFILSVFLEGQDVYYVEVLSQVSGEKVLEIVQEMSDGIDQEARYLRSKVDQYVRIPELKITLSGKKDCKPIEKYGYDLFEKSNTLKKLLREDKVEILTETEVKAIKKAKSTQDAKDKSLNSIILDRPASQVLNESTMFDNEENEVEEETLTENEQILKKHKFGK